MNIPKCPRTVTGRHLFESYYMGPKEPSLLFICSWCKLVDDRTEEEKQEKQETSFIKENEPPHEFGMCWCLKYHDKTY